MKKINWQTLAGLSASLLIAGSAATLMGCTAGAQTASSRPSASQLKEGLTVLDSRDPKFGVSAAYVKSGRVVYIESRVGNLKPEVYRSEGRNEPDYEMDLRIVDHNNFTVFAQRGGDNFADSSWNADLARSSAPVATKADRDADWEAAREGASALAKTLPATFRDHAFHLTNFAGKKDPATDTDLLTKLAAFQKAAPAPEEGKVDTKSGTFSTGSWIQVYTEKWSRGMLYVASHSATDMYANFGAGAGWQLELIACNHGTCPAGGDGMAADCYSWNASSNIYTAGISETGETSSNTTGANDGTGGCQTAYNWDSGSGSHLCNDDAAYELYQSVHGTTGQSGWAITGQSSHCDGEINGCGSSPSNYACNCAGSACSGDWNTPNCGGAHL